MKREAETKTQRGFTLIEILVAMLVFLTGVTGLLALLTTALAMHRDGMSLAQSTREIAGVIAQLQREVAAGAHYDAGREAWVDVAGATLPDGTAYSVRFLPARGDQPVLAELRVAASLKELARARPLPLTLRTGASREAAVELFRSRALRRSPAEGGEH